MRLDIAVAILVLGAVVVSAEVEKKPAKVDETRSFITGFNLTTFTLIKWTTTRVSTLTSTFTCTTSTAALSVCSAGRRRRGLFYDDGEAQGRNRRGLFYNDEEVESKDGSVFIAKRSDDPTKEVLEAPKKQEDVVVPLEVQSGFSLPDTLSSNRFLLAFGTSTVVSYTITSTTSSITATCSSTTNFPTCAALSG